MNIQLMADQTIFVTICVIMMLEPSLVAVLSPHRFFCTEEQRLAIWSQTKVPTNQGNNWGSVGTAVAGFGLSRNCPESYSYPSIRQEHGSLDTTSMTETHQRFVSARVPLHLIQIVL
mmetsp:Transcript_767/g.1811  ORF Transcript_767/g.1811 Transcript_767/m.1811 type:complete len:117 (+) Transcript_767:596-946(+)